jgi:cytochrome c peroxidase
MTIQLRSSTRNSARFAVLATALACSTGPGGLPEPVADTGSTPLFSELELAVIASELGALPDSPPEDPTNAYGDDLEAAALGQKLFFDPRFSANGQVSCATCHIADHGFQDGRGGNTSRGLGFTSRHASTLINAAYGAGKPGSTPWQFWDGSKDSLWAQALGPPESRVEMGSTRSSVALVIHDHYRREYEAVFGYRMPALRDQAGRPLMGTPAMPDTAAWDTLDPELQRALTRVYVNFGKAIAAYERQIVSKNSRFDAFLRTLAMGASDSDELTQSEKYGLKLFIGKAQCISCHRGPNLTDWKFHNIGVRQIGANVPAEDRGRELGVSRVKSDEFNCASEWSDAPDKTQCEVSVLSLSTADTGAFKTPGLRDVTLTAPYFHTGTAATLAEVIDHYNHGGEERDYVGVLDENMQPLDLTAEEAEQLIDFLGSLTGKRMHADLLRRPELPD